MDFTPASARGGGVEYEQAGARTPFLIHLDISDPLGQIWSWATPCRIVLSLFENIGSPEVKTVDNSKDEREYL